MTQPFEMTLDLPIDIPGGRVSSTTAVWNILAASFEGDLPAVSRMVKECPELAYAQFNYTPPVHFAVREGHTELVRFLLEQGAYDPTYRTYPFLDTLPAIAAARNYEEIGKLLQEYTDNPGRQRFKGDCSRIHFQRTAIEKEFETAVDKEDMATTELLLKKHPGLATDPTFFWGEGILTMPAKEGNIELMELLLQYGASFPAMSKWPQFYYFEKYESAVFILQHGMSANHKTWQEVTILHDMAQKGKIDFAALLLQHGADMHAVDDEYRMTPLELAGHWKQDGMVNYLRNREAGKG